MQTADRVGFTATRNLSTDDPMTGLRQMAFTAAHAHDIRVAAVVAAAKAAGMNYDAYVKAANPFRGRKGQKPVYSLSLSFEPGDPTATKENMLKAADEVRHVLGLQGPPVRHRSAHRYQASARAPDHQQGQSSYGQVCLRIQ